MSSWLAGTLLVIACVLLGIFLGPVGLLIIPGAWFVAWIGGEFH